MAHMLLIGDKTVRTGQSKGDFVLAYDFEPTENEKALFDHIEVENVSAEDITKKFEALKDDTKDYPKFPVHLKGLTLADKADLKSKSVGKTATLAILDKAVLKKGTKK